MNSLRCPQCGLLDFASSPECKRCKLVFGEVPAASAEAPGSDAEGYQYWPPKETAAAPEPDWAAFSARLRSGFEEPEEPAAHTAGTVLFAILVCIASVVLLIQVHQYVNLGYGGAWHALTNTGSELYVPVFEKLYWLELCSKAFGVLMHILLLWTFFRKHRYFLNLVSIYCVFQIGYLIVDAWGMSVFQSTMRAKHLGPSVEVGLQAMEATLPVYFMAALFGIAWFFYFRSERVRKIFIN